MIRVFCLVANRISSCYVQLWLEFNSIICPMGRKVVESCFLIKTLINTQPLRLIPHKVDDDQLL